MSALGQKAGSCTAAIGGKNGAFHTASVTMEPMNATALFSCALIISRH
jgi:hypothetical protein